MQSRPIARKKSQTRQRHQVRCLMIVILSFRMFDRPWNKHGRGLKSAPHTAWTRVWQYWVTPPPSFSRAAGSNYSRRKFLNDIIVLTRHPSWCLVTCFISWKIFQPISIGSKSAEIELKTKMAAAILVSISRFRFMFRGRNHSEIGGMKPVNMLDMNYPHCWG